MSATAILAELHAAGIAVHAAGGELRLTAGRGTLTPEMLSAVKSCKQDLLKILPDRSLLLEDLGGSGSRSPSAASVAQVSPVAREYSIAGPPSKAVVEWDRFLACAIATLDGSGLYDPAFGPEMPSGVPGERWDEFIADCGRLGKGRKDGQQ